MLLQTESASECQLVDISDFLQTCGCWLAWCSVCDACPTQPGGALATALALLCDDAGETPERGMLTDEVFARCRGMRMG